MLQPPKNDKCSNTIPAHIKPEQTGRISLPIVFGGKQGERIEEAFREEWKLTTAEMVKRNGEWYAHFALMKTVKLIDKPETVIAIDMGEVNLAVAVSKKNLNKPMKGKFWRGGEIKRIRGLHNHIRRKLQERKLLKKELKGKEVRRVNQQLHIIANQIVEYAKQFPKPVIVMENLNGIRRNFKKSKNSTKDSTPSHLESSKPTLNTRPFSKK